MTQPTTPQSGATQSGTTHSGFPLQTLASTALGLGGFGVIAIGALHAAWGAGISWPARNREQLARNVVGSARMPNALACASVAAPLVGAGAYALAEAGEHNPQQQEPTQNEESFTPALNKVGFLLPLGVGAALLARGLTGGKLACKALRLPAPSAEFVDLDRRIYRPVSLVLGGSLLLGKALSAKARQLK